MSAPAFTPGQRWISVSEPELGLGEIRSAGPRTVTLWFPATRETRQYVASDEAPIRRAAFRAGDTVASRGHGPTTVVSVREQDGLRYYTVDTGEFCETELSHTLSFSSPLERLFAAQFDASTAFETRRTALVHQHERRKSEVRGLVGGRIDLLPHQLGIAAEVTSRLLPRVLLADEVGLGKTIEACLIVHRLLLTGRASRVLIVVPETLVHQWFLELLRRFNLWFHIFTEARCVAIEDADPGANPFLDDQLLLCELTLFTENPARLDQAAEAGWDILVVDEAHHLEWTPAAPGPGYAAIERLARVSPGLLLLTATPEQLGVASHFARLRLLDPDRFVDLEQFARESAEFRQVAHLAQLLRDGTPLSTSDQASLALVLGEPASAIAHGFAGAGAAAVRAEWVDRLLDQHGTGRVMFRNTRATIAGFPRRIARLTMLDSAGRASREAFAREWQHDLGEPDTTRQVLGPDDPRIEWLLATLQSLGDQKVLVICRSQRKALAIEAALRQRTTIAVTAFHEGLTLVQRDRGAASFAEPDGARLLVCSEIGSEGRNFQFAHHLVLFDLPLDPALLEQRLGRLDRIGQTSDIHVHVPVVRGTHLEVLAAWYHEGLDALQQHVPGARELLERFEPRIRDLATAMPRAAAAVAGDLPAFIDEVRRAREETAHRMEEGRDRLLEWNSSRPAQSSRVVDAIRAQDADRRLDDFMLAAFDLFFIDVEEIAPRTFKLGSAGVLVDEFPGLKAEGLTVTRDRARALVREDLQFLTWDHPLTTGAIDLLLGSEKGNCAFARWPDASKTTLYLEATFVLECVAPGAMHADRFLPPTPLTAAVDHRGHDATALLAAAPLAAPPGLAGARALVVREDVRDRLLPRMLERVRELAGAQVPPLISAARAAMHGQLTHEATRLRELQVLNRTVRDEEIALLQEQQHALDALLGAARLRLDSLRLVHRGPAR
ncbi:MAG: RNA polymerase-associated protein RapA [Vicinamibacterales bacterium]